MLEVTLVLDTQLICLRLVRYNHIRRLVRCIHSVCRQNAMDLHVTVGAKPIDRLMVRADLHFLWLAEDEDDLYHASGASLRNGGFGEDEIGQELDLTAIYVVNKHMKVQAGYSHLFVGDFIEASGSGDDVDWFYLQTGFTF